MINLLTFLHIIACRKWRVCILFYWCTNFIFFTSFTYSALLSYSVLLGLQKLTIPRNISSYSLQKSYPGLDLYPAKLGRSRLLSATDCDIKKCPPTPPRLTSACTMTSVQSTSLQITPAGVQCRPVSITPVGFPVQCRPASGVASASGRRQCCGRVTSPSTRRSRERRNSPRATITIYV